MENYGFIPNIFCTSSGIFILHVFYLFCLNKQQLLHVTLGGIRAIGRLRQPPGILIGLSLPHEAVLDEYLANLADAVDTVRASGAKGDADAPPTY